MPFGVDYSMMKERVEKLQEDFNKLGSELLQVDIAIIRYKDALTNANDRKNTLMQKIIKLDDEYQKIKYSGLKVEPKGESNEIKFSEAGTTPESVPTEPSTAG